MKPEERPVPTPTMDSRPFWEACHRQELILPRCRACGVHFFYPRSFCPNCMSKDLEWSSSSGRGKVYSFSVVHTRFFGQPWEIPYAVAIIELEEGVRMLSNVVECPPDQVAIGMPVEVVFEEVTDEITLPKFRPLAAG
ncbi:MAG: Zn-ribbon domain-containing OB-fold protein [Dehalococcoidia bacterium]|nr:Zn-ribbon domain-containing OB-fold protein [Dehalococcoidia bacterium]